MNMAHELTVEAWVKGTGGFEAAAKITETVLITTRQVRALQDLHHCPARVARTMLVREEICLRHPRKTVRILSIQEN